MKLLLKIFFIIFLVAMIVGGYLKYQNHPKGEIVVGLSILFLSFILMPLFIYYRYRNGKYKKYVLDPKSKNPFKIEASPFPKSRDSPKERESDSNKELKE